MSDYGKEQIAEFVKERNAALSELDMTYLRRMMPEATSDHVRLIAAHKARYECVGIDRNLRLESAKWLRSYGYEALNGALLPEGELPK